MDKVGRISEPRESSAHSEQSPATPRRRAATVRQDTEANAVLGGLASLRIDEPSPPPPQRAPPAAFLRPPPVASGAETPQQMASITAAAAPEPFVPYQSPRRGLFHKLKARSMKAAVEVGKSIQNSSVTLTPLVQKAATSTGNYAVKGAKFAGKQLLGTLIDEMAKGSRSGMYTPEHAGYSNFSTLGFNPLENPQHLAALFAPNLDLQGFSYSTVSDSVTTPDDIQDKLTLANRLMESATLCYQHLQFNDKNTKDAYTKLIQHLYLTQDLLRSRQSDHDTKAVSSLGLQTVLPALEKLSITPPSERSALLRELNDLQEEVEAGYRSAVQNIGSDNDGAAANEALQAFGAARSYLQKRISLAIDQITDSQQRP